MARTRVARLAWNRGLISRFGLARADIQRLALAADVHTNFVPRVLGSMSLRPGLQYINNTYVNGASRSIPFVFSVNDKARIELMGSVMRVFIDDAVISRPAVSSAVTNGNFNSDVTGWTDNDEAGATSGWAAGGTMFLTGNGTAAAIRDQTITVADVNVEHALRILIVRGPVTLLVGTGAGDDNYISETDLDVGEHSLAFTPTGNFNIRFQSRLKRDVRVDSCNVEASGDMVLSTPWTLSNLDNVAVSNDSQYAQQSGDIIFVACDGIQQRKIERRASRSWSVTRYQSNDGPFRVPNTGPIKLTASGLFGEIGISASLPFFKSTHGPSLNNDGALLRITSDGQNVTASVTAQNQFTNAISVEGITNERIFTVVVDEDAGGSATFTLQRSLDSDSGPWNDVQQWTADVTTSFNDGLDNQTAWYRLGVKTGDFGSGTHTVTLNYSFGSITGVARITQVSSSTLALAQVLSDFGGTTATDNWSEGAWSDHRGWPTAGSFYEGRLAWAGRTMIWLSVSDGFYSFDDLLEGDSRPILRSIGSGPVDIVNWLLPLQRLLVGGEGAEHSIRSSSLDEVLTADSFNIKAASNIGSSRVDAVKVDSQGIYVSKGGTRAYELEFSQGIDYTSREVTAITPEVLEPRVVRMAVQRFPDTRVHFVLSDGTVALLIYDKVEEVLCWIKITSPGASGLIEDVCVLPAGSGETEDHVYYTIQRTINSGTVRFAEKWALDSDCRPTNGTLQVNKQADSFVTYNQAASSTITGLSRFEGEAVIVWDNGKCLRDALGDIKTFTVASGSITVTNAGVAYQATVGMVGLPFTGQWRSARFPELMQAGSISDEQRIETMALILADTHAKGLKFGRSLTASEMDSLPARDENYAVVDPDTIFDSFETGAIPFPGTYSQNARLCLLAQAPRPCTILAAIANVEHH